MSVPRSIDEWSAVWATSGAAGLSGHLDGPPLDVPIALVRTATVAAATIARHAERFGSAVEVDGPALFGERAAIAGWSRRATISCGGGTRLLRAADGWIAASLVRDADIDAVPAWLDSEDVSADAVAGDPDAMWAAVAAAVSGRDAAALVDRAVLLGMPVARLGETPPPRSPASWSHRLGPAAPMTSLAGRIVVDLSSLWAGPLCAQLLGLAGLRVIKVESEHRPDGARRGPPAVFDLLHGGHETVCLDLRRPDEQRVLADLLRHADVVIEASRPRALAQWGITVPLPGPQVWVSITAHGRRGPAGERVGFGDDAAVAGGLITGDTDSPCFCADAVADPLTGLVAAALVLTRLGDGGRWLLDLSLAGTAALAADGPRTHIAGHVVARPRARSVEAPAAALGTHTAAVLTELGIAR